MTLRSESREKVSLELLLQLPHVTHH
jgi:hypothetical protein